MLKIREAIRADAQEIFDLMMEIARHHDQERFVKTTPEEISRSAFSKEPKFNILLAEHNQQIAGYLSYTINYSIWQGSEYAHLDDLFVRDSFRNKKIGQGLMEAFKQICLEKRIHLAKWEVEANNSQAINFYEKLGVRINIKGICKWMM